MNLWQIILGWFTGGSGGAVQEIAKAAEKITDEVHDHNQNVAGKNSVIAADNAEAAQVNSDVAKAIIDTDPAAALKLLRDGTA